MIDTIQPGRYVVAVSGGVDSVVLLHLLSQQPGLRLTVAHFDHGIREDSTKDRQLVQQLAKSYSLPFVYSEGNLGKDTSEDAARKARYVFLRNIKKQTGAKAIITAHHEDDVLETMIMNILRGTNRKGLSSLRSTDNVLRPLLTVPKMSIIAYAKKHGLEWREDSTNQDETYRRNYVRLKVVPKLTMAKRQELLNHYSTMLALNRQIDGQLANHLHIQPTVRELDRKYFMKLPHKIAMEVLAAWLRRAGTRDFSSQGLTRMVVAAKTAQPHRIIDVNGRCYIGVTKDVLALYVRDR